MRKALIFAIAFLLFGGAQALAGQFGPAEPQTKPGQYSIGFGAFAYSDEWDFDDLFVGDVRQTQVFLQFNYGFLPKWEAYLRAGMANLRIDEAVDADFRDDFSPYGTVGVKGMLRRGTYIDTGVFAEGSYFTDYDDGDGVNEMEIDSAFAFNTGVTFQKEIEGALLYGGPFLHFRQSDFTLRRDIGGGQLVSVSGTAEEDSVLGGLLGIRWTFKDDIVIEGEVQLRDNVSAGAAVSFLF